MQNHQEHSLVLAAPLSRSKAKLVLLIKLNNARSDEMPQGFPLRLVPMLPGCWPTYGCFFKPLCGGSFPSFLQGVLSLPASLNQEQKDFAFLSELRSVMLQEFSQIDLVIYSDF